MRSHALRNAIQEHELAQGVGCRVQGGTGDVPAVSDDGKGAVGGGVEGTGYRRGGGVEAMVAAAMAPEARSGVQGTGSEQAGGVGGTGYRVQDTGYRTTRAPPAEQKEEGRERTASSQQSREITASSQQSRSSQQQLRRERTANLMAAMKRSGRSEARKRLMLTEV